MATDARTWWPGIGRFLRRCGCGRSIERKGAQRLHAASLSGLRHEGRTKLTQRTRIEHGA
jgi:hypothetical protein